MGAPMMVESGTRNQESGKGPRAMLGGKPIGQVEEDAGKKSGFGKTQKESKGNKARPVPGDRHQAGNDAPAHHDPGDPEPRSDAVQDVIARYLEQGVADEEAPGPPTEENGRKPEIAVHRQRGKADVDPVEISRDIANDKEGDEAARDLRDHLVRVDVASGFGRNRRKRASGSCHSMEPYAHVKHTSRCQPKRTDPSRSLSPAAWARD